MPFVAVAAFMISLSAQAEPRRLGPGMTPPKILVRREPEFSAEARQAHVQGNVLVSLVVSTEGIPTQIHLISPLGFGLDERALAAVEAWRFKPALQNGQPVPILATIEVSFRLGDQFFDQRDEEQRTRYNLAVARLGKYAGLERDRGIEAVAKLAKERYPAAMVLYAELLLDGVTGSKPAAETQAAELIEAAARKKYGDALYWKALRQDDLALMTDAANRGSSRAQLYLATLNETGEKGVTKNPSEARRYLRLCATRAPECQWRLAQTLSKDAKPESSARLEALAWATLAADTLPAAREWIDAQLPQLAESNRNYVRGLSKQLPR